MAIRAGLKKNTAEIRNKIGELGIECTASTWGDLIYLESEHCVTWGDANATNIFNCGENEEFFFYLMSLTTCNKSNAEEDRDLYYKGYQRVKKENTKLYHDFIQLQYKYDNLDTTIRNTLIKLQSDIDLEKENIQLKKEIEELKQKLQKNEKKNS
jgi:hypothetical protein